MGSSSNREERQDNAGAETTAGDQPFAGRVVQVTGGTGGIGWACATLLAERGARVALCAHTADAAEAVTRLPTVEGGHYAVQLDVTEESSVKTAAVEIRKEMGKLDGLVHCAGVIDHAMVGLTTEKLMERVLRINTMGTVTVLRYAARLMARQKEGSIVCLSSAAAALGNTGQAAYGASKAGVDAIVRTAARELAPQGIRVNGVAPGYIQTEMTASLDQAATKSHETRVLLQRFGTPREVAEVVGFLVSDAARYVTGQIWRVDGGMLP